MTVSSDNSRSAGPARQTLPAASVWSVGHDTDVVPIAVLRPADSPRLSGEDPDHARLLAESDDVLPPILVQRVTMRVIDGMHRLRAAAMRGNTTIRVRYFAGDDEAAFVRAVRENITHGLPLSLADREAAAARIIRAQPHWSDRAIGAAAGVSGKTVAAIRRQVAAPHAAPEMRVGRDGRRRPLNSAERRRVASELIASNPDASLREVARAAGISPTTVRKVRDEMCANDRAEPTLRLLGKQPEPAPAEAPEAAREPHAQPGVTVTRVVYTMYRDPSLRMTEVGRALLRRVSMVAMGPQGLSEFVPRMPPHSLYLLVDLARACADSWHDFASRLERQIRVSE